MKLNEMLLPEFDQEMSNTRKTLERIPTDKLDWRPHEKSMTMRSLATHLANLPSWAAIAINQDSLDLAPLPPTPPVNSAAEAVETFDKHVAEARATLTSASDEQMFQPWTLMYDGDPIFTMPKMAVLRSFVMSHSIHHRAQLGVYLRLNDVALPSIYGPSADESSF